MSIFPGAHGIGSSVWELPSLRVYPDDMGKKREVRERIQSYKSIGPLLTRQLSAAPPGQLQALHRDN